MEPWRIILILAGIVTLGCVFYCLHLLLLNWETKGYIYYLKQKARSGGANAMMEMQKLLEPQAVHVYELKLEQPGKTDKEKNGTPEL